MIKNIFFDLGGVIITLQPEEAMRRFEALGVSDASQKLDSYSQSGIFGDLESGKIDMETFRTELGKLVGRELTHEECGHAWRGYHKEVPVRNLDTLLRLRKEGYRVILTSNTNPYMMEWAMSDAFDGGNHPLSYYVDVAYLSYKMGVMKPAEEYFRIVLDGEGIKPEETLFVDDGPRNVAAASALGIHTMCPKNGEDWTGEIYNVIDRIDSAQ